MNNRTEKRYHLPFTVLLGTLTVFVALAICEPIFDPDIWYHLTHGNWILSHQAVPRVDYWNLYSTRGELRAYSWLFEVLVATIYRAGSYPLLIDVKIASAVLLAASSYLLFFTTTSNRTYSALFTLALMVGLNDHFALRPQSLTWAYLLLLLAILQSSPKKQSALTYVGIFVIAVLWANSHISPVLGLTTVVLWPITSEKPWRKQVVIFSLIFLFGTLFTPYLGREWLTLLVKMREPAQYTRIYEFGPASLGFTSLRISLAVLVLSLILLFRGGIKRLEVSRLPFGPIAVAVMFTALAITSRKFLPQAVIATLALFALLIRDRQEKGLALDRKLTQIISENSKVVYLISAAIFSLSLAMAAKLERDPVMWFLVPKDGVNFILNERLPHPVLSQFGIGSYLIFRFSDSDGNPKFRVPVDGRTEVDDPNILRLVLDTEFEGNEWPELLSRTKAETVVWLSRNSFVDKLIQSGEWQIAYKDSDESFGYTVLTRQAP